MKKKGANISKANFTFKCHVEIGQESESTEKAIIIVKSGPEQCAGRCTSGPDLCQHDPHS